MTKAEEMLSPVGSLLSSGMLLFRSSTEPEPARMNLQVLGLGAHLLLQPIHTGLCGLYQAIPGAVHI